MKHLCSSSAYNIHPQQLPLVGPSHVVNQSAYLVLQTCLPAAHEGRISWARFLSGLPGLDASLIETSVNSKLIRGNVKRPLSPPRKHASLGFSRDDFSQKLVQVKCCAIGAPVPLASFLR